MSPKFKIYQLELFQYQLVPHPTQDYLDNKTHSLIITGLIITWHYYNRIPYGGDFRIQN